MSASPPPNVEPTAKCSKAAVSELAILALVLGGLVFVLGVLTGIPALICGIVAWINISRSAGRKRGTIMAVIGIALGAFSLPYTHHYVVKLQRAMLRVTSSSKLKQMGLAMHNFADRHDGRLPPASFRGADLRPAGKGDGLSWRVAILPYIEEKYLYRQFHLDEPWNSEHNLKLLERMPRTYRRPGDPKGTTETPYRVLVGNGAVFEWGKPSATFTEISNWGGASRTVLIAEAKTTVPWTKPDELEFDPKGSLPPLGRPPGGWLEGDGTHFLVLYADGSVENVPKDVSPQEFSKCITYDSEP